MDKTNTSSWTDSPHPEKKFSNPLILWGELSVFAGVPQPKKHLFESFSETEIIHLESQSFRFAYPNWKMFVQEMDLQNGSALKKKSYKVGLVTSYK